MVEITQETLTRCALARDAAYEHVLATVPDTMEDEARYSLANAAGLRAALEAYGRREVTDEEIADAPAWRFEAEDRGYFYAGVKWRESLND